MDPSIFGGMIVLLPGDRLIDNSHKKRMDRIMKVSLLFRAQEFL